ncbi:MAG: type IX secretion system sortase PorU [Bacteroidales bacterium]|nr:type IX secretion system sortase PorU [Bacteroidales bacterium]
MIRFLRILSFLLFLFSFNLAAQNPGKASVLSSGKWFRIAITADGIYRIDYSTLKQIGLENPSNPRVFCNNWGQMSYYNGPDSPDDLKELSVFISGNDTILNEEEYLLFFGKGTGRWIYDESSKEYSYLRHNYSDTAFYFITSGSSAGKRVKTIGEPDQKVNYYSSESDALFIHEKEDVNLIKSGREWFQQMPGSTGINIDPGFKNLSTNEKLKYKIRIVARASVNTQFSLYEKGSLKKSILVPGINLNAYTGTQAQITYDTGSITTDSDSPVYEIRFNNSGENSAKGWIDYVQFQGRMQNSYTGTTVQYSDSRSVAGGRITGFSIRSQISNVMVWDISDPFNAKQIQYSKAADSITFKAVTDTLRTFIAFTAGGVLTPSIERKPVPNQDLHSSGPCDMIIVTHPLFRSYADKLANMHFKKDGLLTQVVTLQQVYNEFSGGIPDIAAIRNFVRMKYKNQKGSDHPLKYLLLFGDGSYENKTLPPDNPNFIPTYQSQNSNVVVSSFTSDDFYGLLDDNEGEAEGDLDVGIGRLPVSDTTQAGIIVSKISKYLDPSNMGDWKNVICITADDEDENTHMIDAEGLAAYLKDSVPSFNIEKIYLDAFPQTTSTTGQSYPEAEDAINNRINSGCLIFNYVGHGSEIGLAAERVIKNEDVNLWGNGAKLPLFITATCEFSRFDDAELNTVTKTWSEKTSSGELVLLNSKGGGIALMSTTRVVYSAPNYLLNKNIYNFAFDHDSSGNPLRLGDIIRLAKNNSGGGINKRNFSLLGDPSLELAYPWHGQVITDSINKVSVADDIDSLKALSLITVTGHIADRTGKLINDFNGTVSPIVFDKESNIKTLANDGGKTMEFKLRSNILFSGKTLAKNGNFRFTFIVPRDIDYSFGKGKISYYANNDKEDMNGSFSDIIVGGFSGIAFSDTTGPDIKLYMNDTLFKNGGITDGYPVLLALIEDESGINTAGSGIGHDLTGFLDNKSNSTFVLNNYFENDFDNYMKGKITYNLSGLTEGSHYLTLKAWDNYNNSSEKTILFLVETGEKFLLKNLINYPNPFFNETTISAGHNRPESELDITINIFSMNGRIIKIIKTTASSAGYTIPPVTWDGNDDGGKRVGRGIYPYSVVVTTETGETARVTGRMIIL